jgi:hypothetical protein
MSEAWTKVPDHSGYEVSDLGNVRSWFRGGQPWREPRLISPFTLKGGYRVVTIYKDNKKVKWLVHRLVMFGFGLLEIGKDVNHKNGIKADNKLCNLEMVTRSENHKHAYKVLGRINHKPHAKLTLEQAKRIKYEETGTQKEIAARYGVTPTQVWAIRSGKNWAEA